MSSSKKKNQLGVFKCFDKRSLAYKNRDQAQRKMNEVALELIDFAVKSGIKAKYVLFDSWYSFTSYVLGITPTRPFCSGNAQKN